MERRHIDDLLPRYPATVCLQHASTSGEEEKIGTRQGGCELSTAEHALFLLGIRAMSSSPVCVLVVEDEALIRMSLVDELEDAGFRVLEAATADEAVGVLGDNPNIEAIFTDIDMPGSMDGFEAGQAGSPDASGHSDYSDLRIPKDP